jgi:predicted nicotinamide N-methyase
MSRVRVRYQTIEFGDVDIHVRTLRDRQQFSDDQGTAEALGISSAAWPLFGVVWASSEVLARLMWQHDITNLRILEVGCGIGLTSLVLNHRHADITATDHHPEVAKFLSENAHLNRDMAIPFVRTGWSEADERLGKFDLIVGSDLLYEPDHAELLSEFINAHAKPHCQVIIVDPGRSNRGRFSRRMEQLGYNGDASRSIQTHALDAAYSGHILDFFR